MKIVKIVIGIIVIGFIAGVGVLLAAPSVPQAHQIAEILHLTPLQPVANTIQASTSNLQSQLPNLNNLIGIHTDASASANSQSLPQKTLEYVRYAYCQQVVQDYQTRNSIVPTPLPSPNSSASAHPTSNALVSPKPLPTLIKK